MPVFVLSRIIFTTFQGIPPVYRKNLPIKLHNMTPFTGMAFPIATADPHRKRHLTFGVRSSKVYHNV